MRDGYPPLVIRPEDWPDYLDSIEAYQLKGEREPYFTIMLKRLDASLNDYLDFIMQGK